ncbi:non-structural maintenance of chromosomes element 1 homolog [Diabrotica virgifera virgifera]|uniref:Non-structural maintenance of chromosomes element 1 homolog n=1 Tax=Diabrotica virgifera virgifera TaxID=50390 RepID=A0A6P7G3D1_DIAVI|nr:non-structural maintenance of chromosomes element 1 homolog [Diabrotica virgifera virgifera]
MALTNNHRYFMQYMLKNGATTVNNAQKYCDYISEGEIENLAQLKTLVTEINREISKQSYKLAFNTCEVTNEPYLIWLNTKNDDIAKFQISYSALELEYFHVILQEILRSDEHRITFIVCLNLTSTLTASYSRENGEQVLRKWIKNGYFINKNPYVYLGPRLILEFTAYLKTHLPDSICNLCSELVFWGKSCESCYKTFHIYCLKRYLENQHNCPCCLTEWMSTIEDHSTVEDNNEIEHAANNQTAESDVSDSMDTDDIISSTQTRNRNRNARKNISNISSDEDINEPGPSTRKRHR